MRAQPYLEFRLDSVHHMAPSTQSNVGFLTTNYGIFGFDLLNVRAGVVWPASSRHRYIYGGGFWFGAKKYVADSGKLVPLLLPSFDLNTGAAWFTPGRAVNPMADERVDSTERGTRLNRLYNSVEHDRSTGEMLENGDAYPLWPIWADPTSEDTASIGIGSFVADPDERTDLRSRGWRPGFFGDQEFFSVYRDNNLSVYETDSIPPQRLGYPLGIEVQEHTFTWAEGRLRDVVVLTYALINRSNDTLYECYFAPMYDIDVGHHSNDHVSIVIADRDQDTLQMVQAWTETSAGDAGYGYVGVDMLLTPAVDPTGFLRTDQPYYPPSEQIGLASVRNWYFDIDPVTTATRYEFMATGARDGDIGIGDKRLLISSGPFGMKPGDTACFAVALLFAEGTGDVEDGKDNENLIALSAYLQQQINRELRLVAGLGERGIPDIIRSLNLR